MTRRSILASLIAFLAAPLAWAKPIRVLGLDRGSDRDGAALALSLTKAEMTDRYSRGFGVPGWANGGDQVWCKVTGDFKFFHELPFDSLIWFHVPGGGIFLLCQCLPEDRKYVVRPIRDWNVPQIRLVRDAEGNLVIPDVVVREMPDIRR